jgi:hypothetical protein
MRSQVRIIDNQNEVDNGEVNIPQWEKEMLLNKYGFNSNNVIHNEPIKQKGKTFEELCMEEDAKRKSKINKNKGPKPITFDSDNYYTSSNWDSDGGLNIKVNIVSDMPINRY